ncbi:hypothetical protein LINPERPRIM_LOCUS25195 [Linum perenne]
MRSPLKFLNLKLLLID